MKILNDKDEEIEVYTAEDVAGIKSAERAAVEGEYKPKLTAAEAETQRLDGLLKAQGDNFKQFRKLNDEQVQKLSIAERTIYENGLLLQEEREKTAAKEKTTRDALIVNAIKAKTGADEKAFTTVKAMYDLLGIEANTPEEINKKVLSALGAIGAAEPDALASIAGWSGGGYKPPEEKKGEQSFADSEKGKAALDELGFKMPEAKK